MTGFWRSDTTSPLTTIAKLQVDLSRKVLDTGEKMSRIYKYRRSVCSIRALGGEDDQERAKRKADAGHH